MLSSKNRCCRGDQSTISKLIGMVPIATVMMSQYLYSKEAVSVSQKLKYLTRFTTCICMWGEQLVKIQGFAMIGSSGILNCLGEVNIRRTF